jgi:hypothetical protein
MLISREKSYRLQDSEADCKIEHYTFDTISLVHPFINYKRGTFFPCAESKILTSLDHLESGHLFFSPLFHHFLVFFKY